MVTVMVEELLSIEFFNKVHSSPSPLVCGTLSLVGFADYRQASFSIHVTGFLRGHGAELHFYTSLDYMDMKDETTCMGTTRPLQGQRQAAFYSYIIKPMLNLRTART